MKKLYFLAFLVSFSIAISAQTVIDLNAIGGEYTTTFDAETVLDLALCSSAIAEPSVSIDNPFKDGSFSEAEIEFDIYNYHGTDSIKVLGAIFGIVDDIANVTQRMYFSNGGYLGYNIGNDNWFDANLISYALGTDYLGGESWKNVKLSFNGTGYALYVDDVLAYNESSTDITIGSGANYDPASIITFLQSAQKIAFGTGSWWSDNTRGDGSYWDAQFSYLKNIVFTMDPNAVDVENRFMIEENVKVIREEYYNITGAKVALRYNDLEPGLYIKRSMLDNGKFHSEKILKMHREY